jgi:CRISPR system Cascade subunit CasE
VSGGLWLSRLHLNPRHLDSAKALRDAQALHALTMRCLPSGMTRADANLLHHTDLSSAALLVQTAVRPTWPETMAFRADVKEITPFVRSLGDGERLGFSLRAVPMKRQSAMLSNGSAMRAPGEHALRTDAERVAWLRRHIGLAAQLTDSPDIGIEYPRSGIRNGLRFVHRPVLFTGVIEILDAEALYLLVERGIGRAKSYGCGMLTFSRLHGW